MPSPPPDRGGIPRAHSLYNYYRQPRDDRSDNTARHQILEVRSLLSSSFRLSSSICATVCSYPRVLLPRTARDVYLTAADGRENMKYNIV